MPLKMTDEELVTKVRGLRRVMTSGDPSEREQAEMAILHLYVPELISRLIGKVPS